MPKVTINDSKGLVQSSGSGFEVDSAVALTSTLVLGGNATLSAVNASGAVALASTLAVTGAVTLSAALIGSIDTRAEQGAVSLTSVSTLVTTTNARAITLAAGTAGQIKIIMMTVDGGDATLTPAGGILGGTTTITFGDVGDTIVLVYSGAKWAIISNEGCVVA